MALLSVNNVKVSGVSACVPKNIKEVREQKCFVSGEAEKVIALTHVERSRMVSNGTCCSDLCQAAAEKLIAELNWNKEEIDALVFVSLSRDYLTPATAGLLQHKLGLSKECMAFDIPFACSGYVYGLSVLSNLVSTGCIKKALLLVGETTSMLQSPLDKTLWPLHGDAGTATALEYSKDAATMYFHLGTDGSGENAIINPDGGVRNPITEESLKMVEIEPGIARNRTHSIMDGMNVMSFSLTEPAKSVRKLCENNNLDLESIDYLLLHQANKYIDDKISKKLKVPEDKIPFSLMQYGNTSSASIPMTIVTALGNKELKNKDKKVIMCGFGAGLSWGSAYVDLNNIVCPELVEID